MSINSLPERTVQPLDNGYYIESGYLYFQPVSAAKKKEQPAPVKVCSALLVVARTRNLDGRQHGRLLEFRDTDDVQKTIPISCSVLQTDGAEMRQYLADMGLEIMPYKQSRDLLNQYILMSKPKKTALCVDSLGWYQNFSAYILPDRTIGSTGNERIVFQSEAINIRSSMKENGNSEECQEVFALCTGNSRLVMAVCTAFAAPLVELIGAESGGFNFVGGSSTGKTTALYVAASVYGDPNYLNRWRTTGNGLEAMAAAHNNALLILDELAQVSPREAGENAYMLANGTGKARASVSGGSRPVARWVLLFLSAGEISLAQHMQEGGKKTRAGQEVRMVDIPAQAGAGMGMFEELHGIESPARFAEMIRDQSARTYGLAIVQFLEEVTDHIGSDKLSLLDAIRDTIDTFVEQAVPSSADGQVRRVARRFGLVAVAGELATNAGITGWQEGEAIKGVTTCFEAWLAERGGIGSQEERSILEQVRYFFQSHGDSRFSEINKDGEDVYTIPNQRAGYRKKLNGEAVFMVFPEVFKTEVAKGFSPKLAAKLCLQAGYLLPDSEGKPTKPMPAPGISQKKRFYVLTAQVLGDENV